MDEVLLPKNAVQIVRGTSKILQLSVVDTDCNPVDLTNARLVMTVKEDLDSKQNVFQKTSDSSSQIQIVNARGGLARIFINPADTQHREVKEYVFDVWVVLPSGKRYAVIPPSIFDIQSGVTVLQ